jgi:hypothetical protein
LCICCNAALSYNVVYTQPNVVMSPPSPLSIQSLTEFRPIEIILEECSLNDVSHHDVVQGSRSI